MYPGLGLDFDHQHRLVGLKTQPDSGADTMPLIYQSMRTTNQDKRPFLQERVLIKILFFLKDCDDKPQYLSQLLVLNDEMLTNKLHALDTWISQTSPEDDLSEVLVRYLRTQVDIWARGWLAYACVGNTTSAKLRELSDTFFLSPSFEAWQTLCTKHARLSDDNPPQWTMLDALIRCCYVLYFCFYSAERNALLHTFKQTPQGIATRSRDEFCRFFEVPPAASDASSSGTRPSQEVF